MALPNLDDDLNIIQTLADRPNALDGLSAAQLKQKFDEAGNTIKTFINDELIPALAQTTDENSGADNIGATAITDLDGTTVQALLESVRNKLKATTGGSSGAEFIGASTIGGLTGNTVQSLLEALKTYIDNLDVEIGEGFVSKIELTDTRKLDQSANFTGSWFGISNPAYADPGIAGVVADHTAQLAETVPEITDMTKLLASTYDVGKTIRVNIDAYVKGTYRITTNGWHNGYSMIRLSNNTFAARIYESNNEWMRDVKGGVYSAHKGFNARIQSNSQPGAVPSNSDMAIDLAGQLGFKVVELDAQILSDGTWIIAHDANTTEFLSGTAANLDSIDLSNFKARTMVKEYTAGGVYWTYTGDLMGQAPLTVEEALLIAAKYGMYVMLEIKNPATHVYTETDYQNLATVVKKTKMEEKLILFSGTPNNTIKTLRYLENAIAGLFIATGANDLVQYYSFKNFIAICSTTTYTPTAQAFCETNKIPVNIWTVDDYDSAADWFAKGADIVTSNALANNPDLSKYALVMRYTTPRMFDPEIFEQKSDGTSSLGSDGVISFSTTGFNGRQLILAANRLSRGDIIRVRATAKTESSSGGNVARMSISNRKSGLSSREVLAKFPSTEYVTRDIYFVVNEVAEEIRVSIGMEGQGLTGASSTKFKDVEISVLSLSDLLSLENERYCNIYSFTGAPAYRPAGVMKGIKSIYQDSGNAAILCIDYVPFKNWRGNPLVFATMTDYGTNIQRKIIAVNDNATNGTVRLKIYESDGTPVSPAGNNLNMGFNLLIKNY